MFRAIKRLKWRVKTAIAGVVTALIAGVGSSCVPTPANAAPLSSPEQHPVGKPNLQCVAHAAQKRNIPVDVFLGVQSVERGKTGQSMRNKNQTDDLGAFQINTIHLPRISQQGGSKYDVLHRGCYNADVASLLLSEAINHPKKQHEDFFTRAAGYHSWTPAHNNNYKQKLKKYTNQWRNWLTANGYSHLLTHSYH